MCYSPARILNILSVQSNSGPQRANPFPPGPFWPGRLLACNNLVQSADHVDLVGRNDPGIISSDARLMCHIEYKEDRDADVRGQEVRRVPASVDEIGKPADNEEQEKECPGNVRHVRLEPRTIREVRDVLGECRLTELDVNDADGEPALVGTGVDEVDKPIEHGRPGRGDVEVRQETKQRTGGSGYPGYAGIGALQEDSRRTTDLRHGVQRAAGQEKV